MHEPIRFSSENEKGSKYLFIRPYPLIKNQTELKSANFLIFDLTDSSNTVCFCWCELVCLYVIHCTLSEYEMTNLIGVNHKRLEPNYLLNCWFSFGS